MDAACSACGASLPPGARFCPACGTPVAAEPVRQERRVVSILFADIVGFTQRSDHADPEDVRRTLVPFHRRARREIEACGGMLDKFIGDAAMGVFGAPVAHGDDAVRAVRAALAIVEATAAEDGPESASVRVAVNTGEAVVTFGSGPQVGEAVAGDVVNTASRIQSAAPRNGVVIGDATRRAVGGMFELAPLEPITAKGKAEPLAVWRVVREVTDAAPEDRTPFVGRAAELATLRALAGAAPGGRAPVVVLIGDAGIGKSRLLARFRTELADAVWLQGRCVPYGEDVTFRALAEVLRSRISAATAPEGMALDAGLARLAATAAEDEADATWLRSRLGPVLGLGAGTGEEMAAGPAEETAAVPPEETAMALARVLTAGVEGSLVVAVEDLQWAEPVLRRTARLLADELAERGVLAVCTCRPEILADEAWLAEGPGVTPLRLLPLTDSETSTLVSELASRAVLRDETRAALLSRAGGNPLYAVEFVRMLSEGTEQTGEGDVAVPLNVHALLAARLDAIPSELRALALDASVQGTEFMLGGVAAVHEGGEIDVAEGAAQLVGRGLIEARGTSWVPHEPSYGFVNALLREVAYGRIPRGRRARMHLRLAAWLERTVGDEAGAHAEIIANHYARAWELARAADEHLLADEAKPPALRWLLEGAERATRLDVQGAFDLYERALALAEPGSLELAQALGGSALTGRRSGALASGEALARQEAALTAERALGDPERIARSLIRTMVQLAAVGEAARGRDALDEAVALLEARPPGDGLARVYAFRAEEEMFAGRTRDSLAWAERALELTDRFGGDDVRIMALHIRGDARCTHGDAGGLDDLREALRLAENETGAGQVIESHTYLADWVSAYDGPRAGIALLAAAVEIADRRRAINRGQWAQGGALRMLFEDGEWDRLLSWAEALIEGGPERVDAPVLLTAEIGRSTVRTHRGLLEDADRVAAVVSAAEASGEVQVIAPALVAAAARSLAAGDRASAASSLEAFEEATRGLAPIYRESLLTDAVRPCVALGRLDLAERLLKDVQGITPRDRLYAAAATAALDEAVGRIAEAERGYAEVAERWRAFGCVVEEAHARVGRARCLRAPADQPQASAELAAARATFAALGARPMLDTIDALIDGRTRA